MGPLGTLRPHSGLGGAASSQVPPPREVCERALAGSVEGATLQKAAARVSFCLSLPGAQATH